MTHEKDDPHNSHGSHGDPDVSMFGAPPPWILNANVLDKRSMPITSDDDIDLELIENPGPRRELCVSGAAMPCGLVFNKGGVWEE